MRRIPWLVVVLVGWSSMARAQMCRKDTDCAGDLLCVEGRCTDGNDQRPAPPAWVQPAPVERPRGWARGAGVASLILSSAVLGLGIGAELTKGKEVPSIPLGASATLLLTATIPIAAAGGNSTRRLTGVTGAPGLRISGWILYAFSLALAAVPLGYGVVSKTPPTGMISGISAGAFLSGAFFAIDDFITASQADNAALRATTFSYRTRF
jgi:hypothetical protein